MKELISDITWEIKSFFKRVRNVISWIPTIWSVQWYEYDNFYVITRFTLLKMIKHFKKCRIQYEGVEKDIRYMEICVRLIDILKNETYSEQSFDEVEAKFGKWKLIEVPVGDSGNSHYIDIIHDNPDYDKERDGKEILEIYKKAELKNGKAKKLLFHILNTRLHYWWI